MTKEITSPFSKVTYTLRQITWLERNELVSKQTPVTLTEDEVPSVKLDTSKYQTEMLKLAIVSPRFTDAEAVKLSIPEGDWLWKQVRNYNQAPLET